MARANTPIWSKPSNLVVRRPVGERVVVVVCRALGGGRSVGGENTERCSAA
ncbi:hypothetical protein FQA47_014169 [Oryzias melastigma]|uniref:Uncharacterized protein n=1 Tax=Oryzias melastigma TaxID=30732 RepID=A0A834F4Y3_ORYME|nr:hypothetical protein FQA47_014169 [Oryzias melastigma]